MKIIALAVFLAVMQATPPVPRKAADTAASSSKTVQHNASDQETPPSTTSPVAPSKDQNTSKTPTDANTQETIVIRESAPVPKAGKDWWDKAYVVFTGLLVAIGAYGIYKAKQSLEVIERQAVSMRRQTTHLKNSVIQARRAANAARKSAEFAELATKVSERADILLDGVQIMLPPDNMFSGRSWVQLRFKNFGRTRANNVAFKCSLIIPGLPDGSAPALPEMVLGAGDSQNVPFQPFIEFLTEATFRDIANNAIKLRFEAIATYADVFGKQHKTRATGTMTDPVKRLFSIDENSAD